MAFYSKEYDLFLGVTESFCHLCRNKDRLVSAHMVTHGKEVWLRKFCLDCGESWAMISHDYEYYKKCNDYLKKPDLPECSLTPIKRGCPFDCGVCPQHQNHPCLALFNIIDECNMKCNICYHNSEPGSGNYRSMDDVKKMNETLLKVESAPDLIQVTGGEPSIHPQIIEILKYLKSGPVRHLMMNTNGIRISEDESFVKELKGIGKGFEIYLQFDSLEETALKRLRNANVKRIREQALAMLDKYNISTTLVCVIEKGLNDDEIPKLIEYATKWKCVRGIVFQPIQDVGRNMSTGDFRISLSEIREKIITDQNTAFTEADMIPLPCDPHKICVGYAIKHDGKILPVTGKIPREMITEQKGTIAFEQDRNFINTVIDTVSLDTAFGENIINKESVKRKLFFCWPEFLAPENMDYENVFRIVIMEFSDIYNFDTTNIKRECNFMIEPELAIPFSTYNMELTRSCGK
ncbi:hypothetical protein AUK10_04215 [Candidatus Gracilibacteria bacterium CG2_30_37_12]|nr:MAG: hypothetical protein AUK10_04215 [Candidatus Gracilibacteria bacterium CG2_30_37_12]